MVNIDPLVSSGKDAYLLSTLKRSMQKAVGSACTQGDAVDGSKISWFAGPEGLR